MTPFNHVTRRTIGSLSGSYGPDRGKRIVVTLVPGNGDSVPDVIELRPEGTRRLERMAIVDVYRAALRGRVNLELLTKARERKERKAAARERARIARADAKIRRESKSQIES